jgi:hypothetical protein
MIPPNPRLQVHIAEQLTPSMVRAPHDSLLQRTKE